MNKKVSFYTLGCKVNQYDTHAMMEKFVDAGYEIVDFDEFAHVYIVNTCTVTHISDRKSRQMLRRAHRRNPDAIIGAVGCYAQTDAESLLTIPGIKLVLGNIDRHNIVDYIEKVEKTGLPINGVGNIMKEGVFEETPISSYSERTRVVIKVQEGCNQFCSYCIIPYARGPIRSRQVEDVVDEIKRLASAGFKEVVLTGIHITSYGKDLGNVELIDLIESVHQIDGIERIRLGSLEPNYIDERFVSRAKSLHKLCAHYHLSLQSGSDKTLKRMRRRYTTEEYKQVVARLRRMNSNVSITTDIMVGFPGETKAEFEESMRFVEDISFSRIHVFQYSPREGTPAATFEDQVQPKIKAQRSERLIELGKDLETRFKKRFIDRCESVLFEQKISGKDDLYEGYTSNYIKVVAKSDRDIQNEILPVSLYKVKDNAMAGSIKTQ
ncbi:MAG: tRNA (N(6)-L-threonylcarbamoyladenosine(37)-C(2))-methylthiotransferase MtaB [Clostridiales bacterium]|nr:tRNA (N(6)-L-threonylcarbamoyladenosine(37)-C(2))-methylthiotransferase MtaB [Clostridiales bacterium]